MSEGDLERLLKEAEPFMPVEMSFNTELQALEDEFNRLRRGVEGGEPLQNVEARRSG